MRARTKQQAQRAFPLRAMVLPWPPSTARDFVSTVSNHRSTGSAAQSRWHKCRVRAEVQYESCDPAKVARWPTEINVLRGHALEYEGSQLLPDQSGFRAQARGAFDPKTFFLIIIKKFCKRLPCNISNHPLSVIQSCRICFKFTHRCMIWLPRFGILRIAQLNAPDVCKFRRARCSS